MCGLCFQIRLFNLVLFLFTLDRSDFILPYYSWRVINAQVLACEAPQQLKYSWISKAESGDWQRYLIKSYWANKYSRSTSALLTASREELLRNRLCSLIEMRQHLMLLHLWNLAASSAQENAGFLWAICIIWPGFGIFTRPTFFASALLLLSDAIF